MTDDELRNWIDAYLTGEVSEVQAEALSDRLREDETARDLLLQMADAHACLAVDEALWTQPPAEVEAVPNRLSSGLWKPVIPWAFAACLVVLLTMSFWPRNPADSTFATMKQTRAAFWESGELSTVDGSRLGKGTLRLAEGLATLHFDSGAEVTLEAPATLILADAMNCELTRGTAVADIPESAQGFRIKTPSVDVVDYGTRFAVSVYEETGETHTQVIEGRVQVEYGQSGKVVELRTGQSNTVIGENIGNTQEGANHEYRTVSVEPVAYSPEWTLLGSTKDAYTGRVKGHESEVLLYVKKGLGHESWNRTSYIGFDLDGIDQRRIEEAELLLYFAPTGWGLASHVPDATFSVYGMIGEAPDWDESILHDRFPGEPEVVHLGSFTIPQGVQKGRFRVRSDALADFVRKHSASAITLKVERDTKPTAVNGLVHGFASRRHPFLPAPTLAIRETSR